MKLAAQLRGEFYPAATEAIAHAAMFLQPPELASAAILDSCAGEGAAIGKLGDLLGYSSSQTFAIELDDSRAEVLRAASPEVHILAPANLVGCRASANRVSFIWLNPPYDDGYSGQPLSIPARSTDKV